MVSQPVVSLRYRVGTSPEAWVLPEGPVPESTAHDAALYRVYSLLAAWAARVGNGARIARNLAFRWMPEHPRTGLDPDIAVLLPGPVDFEDLSSVRLWEPGRIPPPFAVEVVSSGHPYKDYARVHEGYAAMGVGELLVFDPMLFGPKALGGPVSLQLWQRDVSGAFERVHFGNEPVYSRVLDAWVSAEGRELQISDDRAASRRWPTLVDEAKLDAAAALARAERSKAEAERSKAEAERSKAEAERSKAEAERSKAEAERSKAEAERSKADAQKLREAHERELTLREELERKVRELEAARRKP
jgi:Uma2 family endonuclease